MYGIKTQRKNNMKIGYYLLKQLGTERQKRSLDDDLEHHDEETEKFLKPDKHFACPRF